VSLDQIESPVGKGRDYLELTSDKSPQAHRTAVAIMNHMVLKEEIREAFRHYIAAFDGKLPRCDRILSCL
jgi:hypothetical protein